MNITLALLVLLYFTGVTLEEDVIGKRWETMFSNYTITEAPDHKS